MRTPASITVLSAAKRAFRAGAAQDRRHLDAEVGAYPAHQDGDRPDDIRSGREVGRRFPSHSPAELPLQTDKSLIWKRYLRIRWPNSRALPCCTGIAREIPAHFLPAIDSGRGRD